MSHLESLSLGELHTKIESLQSDTIVLLTDVEIATKYNELMKELMNSLKKQGKRTYLWKAPAGEDVKTFSYYESCIEFLLEKGVHRKSHIVALGGGALSDFAGFVAATCLRGLSWSVVPTTLVGMIDAAIGGKVAINSQYGKNLVGAFHLPQNIWICREFLSTLPEQEALSGKGEMLKYFFLDAEIGEKALSQSELNWSLLVEDCAQYKLKVTEEDFKEGGKRKILNLGHTFGHAYERIYHLPHGVAVFWGMVTTFLIYERNDLVEKLKEYASNIGVVNSEPPWLNKTLPVEEIFTYVGKDKKMPNSTSVDMILIEDVGKPVIENTDLTDLKKRFTNHYESIQKFRFNFD